MDKKTVMKLEKDYREIVVFFETVSLFPENEDHLKNMVDVGIRGLFNEDKFSQEWQECLGYSTRKQLRFNLQLGKVLK